MPVRACRRRRRAPAAARATSTVARSSTTSQPTAMRPCGRVELAAVRQRAQQDDGARDRERQAEHDAAAPSPSRARRPSAAPSSVATAIWTSAPGTAIARTASRSSSEKWMPTPNISRMTPISASSVATAGSAVRPGRERPDGDAGEEVADDRGQPEPLGDQAADERGGQADRDGGMRTGSWSMALPGSKGGAQDWRGSVPERRLECAGQRYPTRCGASSGTRSLSP